MEPVHRSPPEVRLRAATAGGALRQLSASVRAVRLVRLGRHGLAREIAEPLLRVDGSRPRILVLALLATALATDARDRRTALLEEAVGVAHASRSYSAFTTLPDDLRAEAAAHLRRQRVMPLAAGFATFSGRERIVVEHAVAGGSVPEIAATLGVSPHTVKSQLRSTYRKLGVSTRAELVRLHRRLRPE
ncbi:helix-turn-helix domain-containing protein [Rathayibacter sp. VKM Ac-2754]|uniref:helix-turn-helix domain-containing protein n=1 Tax=Rathayibacter sp. VKM Ac-2754 TaxID=2609251 RepID=UPI0013581326|nr:helix-turn-helix transcriptional regulator [Rathayibacter sp. VKM Ac-2754]MWV59410.1 hypothetical protein [Rathayibacter sp. VKM Ac-2754]